MKISKRRFGVIAAAVGALGALTALGLGGTSALYTSTATGSHDSITSGTVTLTKNVAKSIELNTTGFMPGDSYGPTRYWVDYAGADAFVGLDLKITSTAKNPCPFYNGGQGSIAPASVMSHCTGTGTVPMFNGDTSAGSMDLSILPENGDTAHQLFDPSAVEAGATCSADAAGLVSCTFQKSNVILPPHSGHTPGLVDDLKWVNGNADWVTVKANLPTGAGNVFQGSDVVIDMTAHAVQYANNGGPVGPSLLAGTTLPNGLSGTGNQSAILFPLGW